MFIGFSLFAIENFYYFVFLQTNFNLPETVETIFNLP